MNKEKIKELALANGFKLKEQPDGTMDLNPYVFEFAAALERVATAELKAQVEQLREVLRYADNKLYILTHNRKDVSPRLLTDADKGYKAVHEAVLGFEDNLNVFVAKRDAEIKAQAVENLEKPLFASGKADADIGEWLKEQAKLIRQHAKAGAA